MTFDLNRLAFVTVSEPEAKRSQDLPENATFALNAFSHFFQQQLRLGKLQAETIEKVCKAYHDIHHNAEPYTDAYDRTFRNEILRLNPKELEIKLRAAFQEILRKNGKLKTFSENPDQNIVDFFAFLGIKLEYWGYIDGRVVGKLQPDPKAGIKIPVLPSNANVLKLLIKPRVLRNPADDSTLGRYSENYGFEYDVETSAEATVTELRKHNAAFSRERKAFLELSEAAQDKARAGSDSKRERDAFSHSDGDDSSRSKPSHKPKPQSKPFSQPSSHSAHSTHSPHASHSAHPTHSSHTPHTFHSAGSSSAHAHSPSTSPSSPLSAISGFFKNLGETLTQEAPKPGPDNIFYYLFGMLFQGMSSLMNLFNGFMTKAQAAYENANPGRPLEAKEINNDPMAKRFDHFVRALPRSREKTRETLNEAWRFAKTPLEKESLFASLKHAFLEAGDMESYDKLRIEHYLDRIKDPAAKSTLKNQSWDNPQTWYNLHKYLVNEGSFIEANEILQDIELLKIEQLSRNEVDRASGVVEAYQNAINRLNSVSATLTSHSTEFQDRHCLIRNNILFTILHSEQMLEERGKVVTSLETANSELIKQLGALKKQTEEKIARIPAAAGDKMQAQGKIEAEYKQEKENIERKIAENKAKIIDIQHQKVDIRSKLVEKLMGDLRFFADIPALTNATELGFDKAQSASSSHSDPMSDKQQDKHQNKQSDQHDKPSKHAHEDNHSKGLHWGHDKSKAKPKVFTASATGSGFQAASSHDVADSVDMEEVVDREEDHEASGAEFADEIDSPRSYSEPGEDFGGREPNLGGDSNFTRRYSL